MKKSLCLAGILLIACSKPPEPAKEVAKEKTEPPKEEKKAAVKPSLLDPATLVEKAPDQFSAKFDTSKGIFVVHVERAWAPRGTDRFFNLVRNGFYDGNRFFRVASNFVVQFGIAGDPRIARVWENARFPDDPVLRSNTAGYVTFATAGPNTRTTQLFINLRMNATLDDQGFAPFGKVAEGMDVVNRIYSGYGERPDQQLITQRGNSYLEEQFPNLDYIRKATVAE